MKYGIKLRTDEMILISDVAKLITKGVFDYVELLIVPNNPSIIPFLEFEVEYVVHASHENYGVDMGRLELREFTLKMLDLSLQAADELGSKIVIFHAGTDSLEHTKGVLSNYTDTRVVIENMPKVGINGEACLGYDAKAMKRLTMDRFGICLDFGHAMKASISLKTDFGEIIQEFLKLNPKIFHISDGNFNTEKDEHLNIGVGTYDFKYFKKCIINNPSKLVTLETPRQHGTSLEGDIKILKL